MKARYPLVLFAGIFLALGSGVVVAADASVDNMLSHCRNQAASELGASPDRINVKYEGRRTDGTHAVNGEAPLSVSVTVECGRMMGSGVPSLR